jgi:tripartite-type tricarboxylate transporter receptor subunit TctC
MARSLAQRARAARVLAWLPALLFGVFAAAPVAAPSWPVKPIKLIVAFAPGSTSDSVARILAQELSQRLAQKVLVENRAGAFGQIAAEYVARSAPDGYTVFVTSNTSHAANPHLYRTLPYDPVKDFEPVLRVGMFPFMLVATPSLPVNNVAEFVEYARRNPDQLSYGTTNSTSLVAMETLKRLAKLSIEGVQYKSSPEAMVDLAAGRLQVMVSDFSTSMPQVKGGKVRAIAVTSAKRSPLMPELPPIADTVPGIDLTGWSAWFVPAKTARPIVERLSRELLAILARPDIRTRLAEIGFQVDPLGPEDFARYLRAQMDYWGQLIRAAGIQPQ